MARKANKPTPFPLDLSPPQGGATVRMYRIGHGDCFLLAFAGAERPIHVLIDCGYKPGSPAKIEPPTSPEAIARHILKTTGSHIDIAILTHEHQDHLNAINDKNFPDIKINQTWLAWTEDPDDELANRLRELHKDRLLGLLSAHQKLAAAGDDESSGRIADLLAFEIGGDDEKFDPGLIPSLLSADETMSAGKRWTNKRSMRYFKENSGTVRFFRPGTRVTLPGAPEVGVYMLGPPRSLKALGELDPLGAENFGQSGHRLISAAQYFSQALEGDGGSPPFASRYVLNWDEATLDSNGDGAHFRQHYGSEGQPLLKSRRDEAPDNAAWRRIDYDWLASAEHLAIDMNDETNNSSLVVAFELGKGGKVLLFAADAQAGNWRSWADHQWKDEEGTVIDARDLLARTVLYKVGHHGSHNATLNGRRDSPKPNLDWIALGEYASEFTAMITAVPAWAQTQKGWNHPNPEIKQALAVKAHGRILQTDTPIKTMKTPTKFDPDFSGRLSGNEMFFDLKISP